MSIESIKFSTALATGACLLIGAPTCFAQFGGSNDKMPVMPVSLIDEVSVDLTSGARTDSYVTLSIGDPDSPSLTHTASYKPYGTELGGEVRTICVPGEYSSCQSSFMTFNLGSRVEYGQTSPLTDGSIFSYDSSAQQYHLYDTDGREWIFSKYPYPGNGLDAPTHYLTEIREADGRRLVYNYSPFTANMTTTMKSVVSITSSDGFQLNQVNDGDAILTNRRYINCSMSASTCPAADASWPAVTYGPIVNNSRQVTVAGGRNFTLANGVHYASGEFIRYTVESAVCSTFLSGYINISGAQGQTPQYCERVKKVETPRGAWNYTYTGNSLISVTDPAGEVYTSTIGSSTVTVTDKLSRPTTYQYGGSTFQAGNFYRYVNKNVGTVTYPEGNKLIYGRDSRSNIRSVQNVPKPGSGLPTLTWSASYPDSCTPANFRVCNKPDYVIDANGGRTDFTYDASHGGILTEALPADSVGIRAVRRYGYQQLSATYMGSDGQMMAGSPIWKRVWMKECRSVSACAGTAEEITTTYEYGENLLLRSVVVSADGAVRRTCYGHDVRGNLIRETKPGAGLASCPGN